MTFYPTASEILNAKYGLWMWEYEQAPPFLRAYFKGKGALVIWHRSTNGLEIEMDTPNLKYWFTLYQAYEKVQIDNHTSAYLLKRPYEK